MWIHIEHPKGIFTRKPLSMWLAEWMNQNGITYPPKILHFDGQTLEAIVWVDERQMPHMNMMGDE